MAAVVLKKKRTLRGRPSGPLVNRFRGLGEVATLARLARDTRTEEMSRVSNLVI